MSATKNPELARCKCGNARPPSAVVCVSCAGAALGEMPRPGGKSYAEPLMSTVGARNWLAAAVSTYCGCAVADVEIEDEPQKARVIACVPTSVAPHMIRSAEAIIKREMPLAVDFAIFYYKRAVLPVASKIEVVGHEGQLAKPLPGPSAARHDPREQGPGIARHPVPKPTTVPDVVWTWEAWTLP